MSRLLQHITRLDLASLSLLSRHPRLALLQRHARRISCSADGWLYCLVLPLLILLFEPRRASALLLWALAGFALERTQYFLLKRTFRRSRPAQCIPGFRACIVPADRFSLPSGHSSAAFFVATFLSLGLSPLLCLLAYPWAVGVAASRVVLGVHFPSDTVLGAALGTATALLVLQVGLWL